MKKKFKVRVRYFSSGWYCVEYAWYRFIPNWNVISFWFDQGVPGGTECWSTELFQVNKAEEFASTLKSIEDVNNWYSEQNLKRDSFYKKQTEYYKKNVPYQTKEF